jgi:hypothetical protein
LSDINRTPAVAANSCRCAESKPSPAARKSRPAEVKVLRELGCRALLGVGIVDGQHGYLVEIYLDNDHTELTTVAPHARVLAHYCVRNANTGHNSTRGA